VPLVDTYRDVLLRVGYAGRPVEVSARVRTGGDDLLLCVHGFGCAKESFDSAFEVDRLGDLTICAFDLPGHGASGPLPEAADAVQAYADIAVGVIRQFSPRRTYLVGHSMGGAVGLVASQDTADTIGCFVSVEGNLVTEDCGLVSRGAAAQSRDEFVESGYPGFRSRLAAAPEPDLRAWAGWYGQADPVALHQAARSLVEWSDSGKLLSLFTSLPFPAYVHGGDSADLGHLLPSLHGLGVPVLPVPGARHFPMLDNPEAFWAAVAEVVDAAEGAGSGPRYGAGRVRGRGTDLALLP
jgi:pimeloyl-ACP methyl ester carboxylesterase